MARHKLDAFEYRGIACEVFEDSSLSGIRWAIPGWQVESQGAFYLDSHGYSVGAVIGSCGEACRRWLDKSVSPRWIDPVMYAVEKADRERCPVVCPDGRQCDYRAGHDGPHRTSLLVEP